MRTFFAKNKVRFARAEQLCFQIIGFLGSYRHQCPRWLRYGASTYNPYLSLEAHLLRRIGVIEAAVETISTRKL